MAQFRPQRVELALHAGDLGFTRREGVLSDGIGFECLDTPDFPIPPVLDPRSRQTQRLGCRRDPVADFQAGGSA